MLPQYTTEQLIANIKRRCTVPTSQLTYTPDDFVDLANDELQGEVVPLLMSTREEYFVDFVDIPAPADRIIPFPENTTASKVRSVCYIQPGSPLILINLPRIDLDVVAGVGFNNFNTLAGFFIQGNEIHLWPTTSVPVGTTIRIYYYRRTLALAPPGSYGQVVAIDSMTNSLQLDALPLAWAANTEINAIYSKPGFTITNPLMTVVSVSSPTIVVDDVTGVSVGDYVSDYGYSPIPQIPIEAHAYLAQLTAAKCLEGLGDSEGMTAAMNKAEQLKKGLLVLLSQRVDGSTKKVMNASGGLRLGSGLGRWGRGGTGSGW